MAKNLLLLTAKFPDENEVGRIKSRLHPLLQGKETLLYQAFLIDAIDTAKKILNCDRAILGFPGSRKDAFKRKYGIDVYPTDYFNIMESLKYGFSQAFQKGYQRVIAYNTDSPDLPTSLISDAFIRLGQHDVVIGPTEDGGYYLIGMKKNYPYLFNKETSTTSVLQQALSVCQKNKLVYSILPQWQDIDTPEDLKELIERLRVSKSHTTSATRKILRQLNLLPS